VAIDMTFSPAGIPITTLETRENSLVQAVRAPTDDAKIDKGAKEFEAVLLGSWLQQAEQSFATIPGADDDQEPGRDQMMSMGVQSLATAMAASGALGIGPMIAKAMHHLANKEDAAASQPAAPTP
jgi:Rod binding domain-containing protein